MKHIQVAGIAEVGEPATGEYLIEGIVGVFGKFPVYSIAKFYTVGSRITSYNVCYTKLLRIHGIGVGFGRFAEQTVLLRFFIG